MEGAQILKGQTAFLVQSGQTHPSFKLPYPEGGEADDQHQQCHPHYSSECCSFSIHHRYLRFRATRPVFPHLEHGLQLPIRCEVPQDPIQVRVGFPDGLPGLTGGLAGMWSWIGL